MTSAWM